MKPGYTVEEYAEGWVAASKLIQRAPGALGTRLHRKIGTDNVVLAIATWDSKSARDAMDASVSEEIQAIIRSQVPFIDIHPIGEYEAPEWTVIPEGVKSPDGWS